MQNHCGIADMGACFVIDANTRKVTVPPTHKVIGSVGDHNSEQLTIKVPLKIDGHAIMGCDRKYVTWTNASGETGHDELVYLGNDESFVHFTWTIRNALTNAKGLVHFAVHFEDMAEDGETIVYRWSTTGCASCEILDSINAVLGAYRAMWVNGEKLVIEDYTPVGKDALELETLGIIPEGVLEITENGTHDVGPYAQVDVAVGAPEGTLEITENGTHDVGPYAQVDVQVSHDVTCTVRNRSAVSLGIMFLYLSDDDLFRYDSDHIGTLSIAPGEETTIPHRLLRNSVLGICDSVSDSGIAGWQYTAVGTLVGCRDVTRGAMGETIQIDIHLNSSNAVVEIVDK